MTIKAGLFKEYENNFILDESKLRKIVNLIEEFSKKLKKETYILYIVNRKDNSQYETKNIEDILADDNIPEKCITSLGIKLKEKFSDKKDYELTTDQQRPIVIIAFTLFRYPKIEFGVTGENRDWCILLTDELDNQIKRILIKSPFSFLSYRYIDFIIFPILIAVGSIVLFFIAQEVKPLLSIGQIKSLTMEERSIKILEILASKKPTNDFLIYPVMMIASAIMFVILEIKPLNKLFNKIFRSVFHWGDMARVYDKDEKLYNSIKWIIIIGFIISLIASIIAKKI